MNHSIVIRNVSVMMAYAFQTIRHSIIREVSAEDFDHLHDLLAEILAQGVGAQVKRGLHRDYIPRAEELSTVRGQIKVAQTLNAHSLTRGRLVCEFDEYDINTPHNQAVKSAMRLLIRNGTMKDERRLRLQKLLPFLVEVDDIAPNLIRWETLIYHRTNAEYRLLLGTCELIIRGLLPTDMHGSDALSDWLSDEEMSRLYERFLLEYYRFHHPELNPGAPYVSWDFDPALSTGTEQLPAMKTDLTLRQGSKTLIIDAKYYGDTLQTGRWGKKTVHSSNLYQILSYIKNADNQQDGSVSGLLLYAATRAPGQPSLDIVVQGNRIGAQALDLSRPWAEINNALEGIIDWIK